MKNYLFFLFLFVICSSCTSPKNSEPFIKATEGRYLFNANEVLEVFYKDQELFIKWRGRDDIQPLKVNDSAFYVKALNEKMLFVSKPEMHIELAPKTEHKGVLYHFKKLKPGEKTAFEYLTEKDFEKATESYLAIKAKDSLDPLIKEYTLNSLGYQFLRNKERQKAIAIFKINTLLYPKSSNTFDSLADSYLAINDTLAAVENYKKALAINPENRGSKRNLIKLTEKK